MFDAFCLILCSGRKKKKYSWLWQYSGTISLLFSWKTEKCFKINFVKSFEEKCNVGIMETKFWAPFKPQFNQKSTY